MRSVFEKYDGKNTESRVVDYLQEQVRKYLTIVWKRTVGPKQGIQAGKGGERMSILELGSYMIDMSDICIRANKYM